MIDVCTYPPDRIGCVEYSIGDTEVLWRAIEDLPPSERRAWWPGAADCEPADETPSEKRSRPLWLGRMGGV